MFLWLWRRPAAAAPIGPLAWELPHAAGAALKRKKEGRKGERKGGKKKGRQGGREKGREKYSKEETSAFLSTCFSNAS